MAAPVAGLFATLGLDDGPWAAGLRRASQQARDFRSVQEREFRATTAATEGMSRSMRGSLGNVAQQIQDVAVQFQSGTSAAVIFAQQGPQILSAFGPLGGMFGALAGVTAVAAGALLGLGKEADSAKAASDALATATHGLDGTIAGSADSVADLTGKYRALSDEMRTIERLSLGKKIRENEEALVSIRDQIAASVQAAKDSGQLALLQQSEALAKLDKGAVRDPGTAQLQQFLEGLDTALSRSAKGGLTEFADQVDRLVTGLPEAGSDARKLADSFIAPAEGAIKAANSIKQAQAALDGLAGKPIDSKGGDPFAGFKDAPKELERVREDIQRGLDSIAATVVEKKRVVDREMAETFAAITKQRSVPGADQHLLDEVEAQAKKLHSARLARIDEEAAKEAEAAKARATATANRIAAAQRVDQAEERRLDAIGREIEQLKRLDAANRVSAAEYAGVKLQIEAENAARALGVKATPEQIAQMQSEYAERAALQASIKATTEARERETKVWEDYYAAQAKALERRPKQTDAEKQAQRDAENLQRNLQTNVASAIERGFEDGFGSVADLVDQFGSLLKSTVATALADQIVTKAFAESVSGALETSLGSLAPSLANTRLGNTTVAQAGGGALGAAFGGYALGQQFAGNRPLGTLAGAAGGALLGTMVAPGIGTAIGGGIGGLAAFLGSGSTGGTRNNNYQAGFDPLTGLPVEFQNTKPDPQNQGIVGGVLTELAALRAGLRSMGLGLSAGEFTVQAGNKSGLTLNGQSFGSASALTEAALRQLLGGATGLSAGQQTVLANSKAKDAADLLSDLAIPDQIQALLNPLSNFSTALKEQTRLYAEANDNATRLGLSTKGLSEAQERDRQKLVDAYKAELGLLSPVEVQIRSVIDTFEQAIRSVKELGVSEELLVRQRDKQLAAIRDQLIAQREQAQAGFVGNVQQRFGYVDQFRQFQDSLAVSNDNGTAQTRLREAQRQFELVRRGALVGDVDALGQLTQVGQSYITAARDYGGSGAVFQDAFKSVNDVLTKSIERGETLEERLLEGIQGQTKTINDFYRELMMERREMKRTMDAIERELELLRKRAA